MGPPIDRTDLRWVPAIVLENLALRQQLTVLKRRHPKPKLSPLDKLFWVSARRFWSAWKSSLIIVTPEAVVRWHRAGFRRYWSLISRVKDRVGRKKLSQEIRDLIFQMVTDNSTWGAPRGYPLAYTLWNECRIFGH